MTKAEAHKVFHAWVRRAKYRLKHKGFAVQMRKRLAWRITRRYAGGEFWLHVSFAHPDWHTVPSVFVLAGSGPQNQHSLFFDMADLEHFEDLIFDLERGTVLIPEETGIRYDLQIAYDRDFGLWRRLGPDGVFEPFSVPINFALGKLPAYQRGEPHNADDALTVAATSQVATWSQFPGLRVGDVSVHVTDPAYGDGPLRSSVQCLPVTRRGVWAFRKLQHTLPRGYHEERPSDAVPRLGQLHRGRPS